MTTKSQKKGGSLLLCFLAAAIVGLSVQFAQADELDRDGYPKGISSTDDGYRSLGATAPWTAEEMSAAIPYPMADLDEVEYDHIYAEDVAAPTGPSGFMPGALPNGKSLPAVSPLATQGTVDPNSVSPLGYAYPPPFNRLGVGRISPYTRPNFRTTGKLFFRQYGTSYVCSASVIGNRGIVTAGHCVHRGNNSSQGWSTNVVFVPAYKNGAAPYGQWPVPILRTFTDWYRNGSRGDFDHDWGAGRIIHRINNRTIGQTVGYLGYAWNWSRNNAWWQLGYPAAAPFNGRYMIACTSSFAYNSRFYRGGPAPMTVGCDMTGGSSGGPWILKFGSGNYVNGVNSHRATARTKEMSSPYADLSTKNIIFLWVRNF